MAVRKTKLPAHVIVSSPSADELPVTRLMLADVRTELLERMDKSEQTLRSEMQLMRKDLLGEIQGVRTELQGEIQGVRTELQGDIQGVKADVQGVKADVQGVKADIQRVKADVQGVKADVLEIKADLHLVKADLHLVKADLHDVKASVARIAFLVEEQNVRNKIVLDALTTFMGRQERVEQRMDAVEETVRDLAASRRPT